MPFAFFVFGKWLLAYKNSTSLTPYLTLLSHHISLFQFRIVSMLVSVAMWSWHPCFLTSVLQQSHHTLIFQKSYLYFFRISLYLVQKSYLDLSKITPWIFKNHTLIFQTDTFEPKSSTFEWKSSTYEVCKFNLRGI